MVMHQTFSQRSVGVTAETKKYNIFYLDDWQKSLNIYIYSIFAVFELFPDMYI